MKSITDYVDKKTILEKRGDNIDEQWINDEKPVMTKSGKPVIITKVDISEVPNIIHGDVKLGTKTYGYEWLEDGTCTKAIDRMGNPKQPDEDDMLVKAM